MPRKPTYAADLAKDRDKARLEAAELLRTLREMVTAHSMQNVGIDASMRRLNAIKAARAVIAKYDRKLDKLPV